MEPLKVFTLRRTHNYSSGVFGVLDCEGEPFAVTVENPQTLIPRGEYSCTRDFYNIGNYETYLVNVPQRSRILFHKGNWHTDSQGCILVGESFAILKGRVAIAQSADGFKEFMDRAKGVERFTLVICDCPSSDHKSS